MLPINSSRLKLGRRRWISGCHAALVVRRFRDGKGSRESLRSICADPRMPSRATVCRWLARHQEFRRLHALARACQLQAFANEMLEIADHCSDLRYARHRIGALKLAIARMTPRKYGNR